MQGQKGSGIICALMTTSGLILLMSLAVRYTTYGIDIAHQRLLHEQHYFALQGLLNYGLMIAQASPISDSYTIDIDSWLTHYTGKIFISVSQDSMNVHTYLYVTQNQFIDAEYFITKNENNWQTQSL